MTWLEFIDYIGAKGKPVLIAAGAATLEEVRAAVGVLENRGVPIGLFQCNTNYTGSLENLRYIRLNVLKTFRREFPNIILGLSDHTPGHSTVLGAVALGARLIEKRFTDDNDRDGPDHPFSMTPKTWREMVDRNREVESALGGDEKKVEENEPDTVVIQRRGIRAHRTEKGNPDHRDFISVLRPAPRDIFRCRNRPGSWSRAVGRCASGRNDLSESNRGGESSGVAFFLSLRIFLVFLCFLPLPERFLVLAGPPPELSASLEEEVETIWRTEKAKRGQNCSTGPSFL